MKRSLKRGACLLVALLALPGSAGSPPSLAVKVDAAVDRALGCRLAKPMATELKTRLGARIDAKAALRVEMKPGFELVLTRGTEPLLRRTLKRAECADLALSAALVVERFLASVSWSGSTQMPAKLTPRTPDIPLPARVERPVAAPSSSVGPKDAGLPPLVETAPGPAAPLSFVGPQDAGLPPVAVTAPRPAAPPSVVEPKDAGPPPVVAMAAATSAPPARGSADAGSTPLSSPAPVAATSDTAPEPPVESTDAGPFLAASPSAQAPETPTVKMVALSVGPAASFDGGKAPFPSLVLEAAARWRAWRASVLGQGQLPLSYPVEILGRPRGQLTVQPWWALAGVGLCRDGAFTGCAQVGGGALYASGVATGTLNSKRPASALVPTAAALGRLSYGWAWGAEVGLLAILAIPLGSGHLDVEGTSAAYSSPVVSGTLALTLGFSF